MLSLRTARTGHGANAADDTHAAVLLETTITLGDRHQTSRYVDVYRLRDGRATEHWHLPLDQNAEAELFAG